MSVRERERDTKRDINSFKIILNIYFLIKNIF